MRSFVLWASTLIQKQDTAHRIVLIYIEFRLLTSYKTHPTHILLITQPEWFFKNDFYGNIQDVFLEVPNENSQYNSKHFIFLLLSRRCKWFLNKHIENVWYYLLLLSSFLRFCCLKYKLKMIMNIRLYCQMYCQLDKLYWKNVMSNCNHLHQALIQLFHKNKNCQKFHISFVIIRRGKSFFLVV